MLQLRLLGAPEINLAGQAVAGGLSNKAQAILAYLAVTGQPQTRTVLATLLWGDMPESTARTNLRKALAALRQKLAPYLQIERHMVAFRPEIELWIDTVEFEAGINAASAPIDADRLQAAIDLYQGDFLTGFYVLNAPDFEAWMLSEQARLRESVVQALHTLATHFAEHGDLSQGIAATRRLLNLEPWREEAHRQLMLLLAYDNQRTAALAQFETCREVLAEELGVEPGRETIALYEHIRDGELSRGAGMQGRRGENFSPAPPHLRTSALPSPHPHPETHYVQNGDIFIAYQVIGEGLVDIVLVNGFISHLEQIWQEPGVVQFLQRLSSFGRLILFDKRGVGLSDRVGYPPSLEYTMDDILAVVDAIGSQQIILFGVSEGGPNSILFAATYPHKVLALILYGAVAKFTKSPDYPWALTHEQFNLWLKQLVQNWGDPASIEFFAPTRARDEHLRSWWAQLLRLASSPGGVKGVLEVIRDIDVRHVLPAIHVPTLVLHRTGDRVTRVDGGRYVANQIPGAKFVELPGQDHWWWIGETEPLLAEIEAFIKNPPSPSPIEWVLATIWVTELIGHESGLESFRNLVADTLRRFDGREVNHNDRLIVATFDGPSRAIRCAQALNQSAKNRGLAIRSGLHTGECEHKAGMIGGLTVQVATEVKDQAKPGQVLVSRTVKDLVIGSGFHFQDHGPLVLSGELSDWQVLSVA